MKYGNIDGQGLAELQNLNFQNLSSAPTQNVGAGRFYFNTADHTLYVYNGTSWMDALAQGKTYTFSTGLTEDPSTHTVTLNLASTVALGGVIIGSNINVANDGTISVSDASTTTKGVIEIATDTEASTGTSTTLAVTPKQLATKVPKLTTGPTAGTYTKVTVNSDGLVTTGASLDASDIPNLTLSKITDVTASASEVNVLDGITASTAELNIMDGVTVTTSDINSIPDKIELTDLSIASGSTNYLTYNNANGQFGAKVDTTVTQSSTNLVTSGAVQSAIDSALTGALKYQGTWTATNQTDYSSITLPVKKGYMYAVSGNATIGGVEWNSGDYLVINKYIASGGTITSSDVEKIDNTEASDIVRLAATQTLTNKTIDADDNTITDLGTSNFKSGVVRTFSDGIRTPSNASDTAIVTEKNIATVLASKGYTAQNTALTQSGGLCTWTVTHNLNNSNVGVFLYEVSSGERVMYDYAITSANAVAVKILSTANIAANTYKVVVFAV